MLRLFISLVVLVLSVNLAGGQNVVPVDCSVLQSEWSDFTENRYLVENRSYGTGHRVGKPISINRELPHGWLFPEYEIVNQSSPKSFYIGPFTDRFSPTCSNQATDLWRLITRKDLLIRCQLKRTLFVYDCRTVNPTMSTATSRPSPST